MKKTIIERVALLGGLLAAGLVVVILGVIGANLLATTLTQTTFAPGTAYNTALATLTSNVNALLTWANGNITNSNWKPNPSASEKLDGDKVNFVSCGAGNNTGCVPIPSGLDPNGILVSAAASSGAVTLFGPLRGHAQTTPDLTAKVEAGAFVLNGTAYFYAGGTSPPLVRPTTNPRIALLAMDANGAFVDGDGSTAVWIYGDEATSSQAPPPVPRGVVPIVYVFSRTQATCISIKDTDDGGSPCYVWREGRTILDVAEPSDWRDDFNYRVSGSGVVQGTWSAVNNCTQSPTGRFLECACAAACAGTHARITGRSDATPADGVVFLNPELDRGGTFQQRFKFRMDDIPETAYFYGWVGATDPTLAFASLTDYAVIKHDTATTFKCETRKASGAVNTSAAVTWPALSTWIVFETRISASRFEVFMNGRSVCALTDAAKIPDTVRIARAFRGELAAATTQNWDIDWYEQREITPNEEP